MFGHFLDPNFLCKIEESKIDEEEENICKTDDVVKVHSVIRQVSNIIGDLDWNVDLLSTIGNELC